MTSRRSQSSSPPPPSKYAARKPSDEEEEATGELTIRKLIENCQLIDKRLDTELGKLTNLKREQIDRLAKLFPVDDTCRIQPHNIWIRSIAERLLIGFSLHFADQKLKPIEAVILFCDEKSTLNYTIDSFEYAANDSQLIIVNFKLAEFLDQSIYTLSGFIECDRKQIKIEQLQIESKNLIKSDYKLKPDRLIDGKEDFYALLAVLPKHVDFMRSFCLAELVDLREQQQQSYLQSVRVRCTKSNLFYLHDNRDPNDLTVIEIDRENRSILSLRTNNYRKFQLVLEQNKDFERMFRKLPPNNNRSIVDSFVKIVDRIEQYLDSCPIVNDRVFLSHNRQAYRKFLHDIVNDQLEIDENC